MFSFFGGGPDAVDLMRSEPSDPRHPEVNEFKSQDSGPGPAPGPGPGPGLGLIPGPRPGPRPGCLR